MRDFIFGEFSPGRGRFSRMNTPLSSLIFVCFAYFVVHLCRFIAFNNNIGMLCRQKGLGWRRWAGLGGVGF